MRSRILLATAPGPTAEALLGVLREDHDVVFVDDEAALAADAAAHPLDAALVDLRWVSPAVLDAAAAPVVALVPGTAEDALVSASQLGCSDVVRADAAPAEAALRMRAAVRLARAEQDLRAAQVELGNATRTDHTTGLANRRHVDEHLAMAASAARRHRQPMSLLLVDIDHLKRVNDAIGHVSGDAVIRTLAARLAHVLRGEDMAGRWGGDEFLVVAPSTDLDGAWRLGERIRDAVTASPIALDGGRDVVVTVSIGCSTGAGDDLEAQLRQAEHALDQARAAGRNRVVVVDASIMS